METGVGASLHEARKRRELDLADVEAAIKIRVRYLQAIEDEDWDVLPGDVYVRGFIRTYAAYLGLDGERLAEQYRDGMSREGDDRNMRRVEPVGSAVPASRGRRPRGRLLTALVVLALAGLLIAIGLVGGDDDGGPVSRGTVTEQVRPAKEANGNGTAATAPRPGISLGVVADAEVWACLLDADEEPLIDGEILAPGEEAGPFRSKRFSAAFGNGAFELTIDGQPARTEASSGPVGYEIDAEGELTPLAEGERPDCL